MVYSNYHLQCIVPCTICWREAISSWHFRFSSCRSLSIRNPATTNWLFASSNSKVNRLTSASNWFCSTAPRFSSSVIIQSNYSKLKVLYNLRKNLWHLLQWCCQRLKSSGMVGCHWVNITNIGLLDPEDEGPIVL